MSSAGKCDKPITERLVKKIAAGVLPVNEVLSCVSCARRLCALDVLTDKLPNALMRQILLELLVGTTFEDAQWELVQRTVSSDPPPATNFLLRDLVEWLPTIRHFELTYRPAVTPSTSIVNDLDLAVLAKKLPCDNTPEAEEQRAKLFSNFDPNGNGFLSLAEIDKGARDVLQLGLLFDCKPVLMRAFQAARRAEAPNARNHNGDYVTLSTFRHLLWYLKEYFYLWSIFCKADQSNDRRVSASEFESIVPMLVKSGSVSASEVEGGAKRLFDEVDRDHGGMVLFEEFSEWALARGLMSLN